jgi:hypothetical protein
MSNLPKSRRIRRRSPVILIGILLIWSLLFGWGFSQAMEPPKSSAEIGTVDAVPGNFKLAQDAYLENCATCHIGIPPAIFPTETWRDLLQDTQHYGVNLTPITEPGRSLIWRYLRTYSRQVEEGDRVPYRVNESKAFKLLHPKVELPKPLNLSTCITCHPGTNQYNFRKLSADWENAP